MKILTTIFLALLVTSCVGIETMIEAQHGQTPDSLRTQGDDYICFWARSPWTSSVIPMYLDEAKRRDLVTDAEAVLIKGKRISIGMSECAMYMSWGVPARSNVSMGIDGKITQYVYEGSTINTTYVYVVNGRVVRWSERR